VAGDSELLGRLRGGDEEAFAELAGRYHASVVDLAAAYVPGRAAAEEVALGTWLGVLRGLDGFDGRAPVKTWLFRILVSRARSARERERGSVPVADPAVGPGRFDCRGDWACPPRPWPGDAVERLRAHGARPLIRAALDELPAGPRRVVLLRDVEGLAGGEVCELLGVSEATQRVLLHHGRTGSAGLLRPKPRGPEVMAWPRTGMVCRKAADLVTEYLEDALPPGGRARFEAHLAGCPLCAEYRRQLRITISAVRRAGPGGAVTGCPQGACRCLPALEIRLARISAPPFRPLGFQVNSKWSWRPPHQGTVVSAGRLAWRRTGE